jgi:cilia- and flagella-associated protein 44
VVGFSDGIVRFVGLDEKKFTLIKAFKVHRNPIVKVKCNREGSVVVAADTSGALFFISLDSVSLSKITPYCLFETGFKINDLSWDRTGDKVLLACQDGRLHEIDTPREKDCDFSETYLKKFSSRTFVMKMMESQKPNKEDR